MNFFEKERHWLEWINHNRLPHSDGVLVLATNTVYFVAIGIALGFLLWGILKNSYRAKLTGQSLLLALLVNTIILTGLKHLVNRERPFVSNSLIQKLSTGGSPSFPSGHTADAFLIAFGLSMMTRPANSRLIFVWLWALVVGYSRMALGVHYPSDVLGSVLIAFTSAIVIKHFFFTSRIQKFETWNDG